MADQKLLMAFDCDQTMIEGVADLKARDIIPSSFTEGLKHLYSSQDGWTEYMKAIFNVLHTNGVTGEEVEKQVKAIPLVAGMQELFEHMGQWKNVYEIIIISDSNTLFINWSLQHHELVVDDVYSNPAKVEADGKISLEPYHQQNWCDMSPKNMCKAHILQEHITKRQKEGTTYAQVCYIGDGRHDYCPILNLSCTDIAFVRQGNFKLWPIIKENESKVKAEVVKWKSGEIILERLRELIYRREECSLIQKAESHSVKVR